MANAVTWRAYYELCKPRVVALMLLTAIVGMLLATEDLVPWRIFVFGIIGIALAASSGATFNHLADKRIDAIMHRTKARPIPSGQVSPRSAIIFASILGILGLILLVVFVNTLTAILAFITLVGYALIIRYF